MNVFRGNRTGKRTAQDAALGFEGGQLHEREAGTCLVPGIGLVLAPEGVEVTGQDDGELRPSLRQALRDGAAQELGLHGFHVREVWVPAHPSSSVERLQPEAEPCQCRSWRDPFYGAGKKRCQICNAGL